ncbi:MAG: PQQ-binding-like beta-propeller repeat protein [Lewinellaceae bacterium]|nr:PQQ-binding-like beta-propeller repeat protein [Lewinellaceae bacterium]
MRLPLILVTALCLCAASQLHAQRQADWSLELTGNAQGIIFQHLTGVPIVQTEKAYMGIDPAAKKIIWTADRSGDKAMSGIIETGTDFYNMAGTPYVLIRHNLMDSRTGQVLIDKEKEGYKRVEDYEIIPSLNSLLVRTKADGKLRLYLVAMTDNKVLWKTDVMKSGGITLKSESENEPVEESIEVPVNTTMLTPGKHLLYTHKKNVACIESGSGNLLWVQKAEPAEIQLSPDGKNVLVIEAESGGLMALALAGTGAKLRSKKLTAYDLLTGKEAWKDPIEAEEKIRWMDTHPDFLTVVHKKGCNLYNYATGEKLWKRDFEGRRITEILPNNEGYLITFNSGYKTMQLSKEGKELWKKAQVKESEDGEAEEMPEEGGVDRYSYAKGDVLVTTEGAFFTPAKGSGMKRWKMGLNAAARVAYDPNYKNLIILTGQRLVMINPDKNPKVALEVKVPFENAAEFHTLEIREKSYFLSSQQEFVVFDAENGTAKHKFYKKPFDSKAFLANAARFGMAVGSAVAVTSGVTNAGMGGTKAVGSTFGMMPPGSGDTEIRRANRQMNTAVVLNDASSMIPPVRFEAFRLTRDFAYYFTKEKSGDDAEKMLIEVNKDSGEETDKLIFDNARPLYQVDEIEKRVYYANKSTLKVFNM